MRYKIHPIVLGTKEFDKGMMTYQHGYGEKYTIPLYAWYLEGGDKNILVDTGEMHPIRSEAREEAIGGRIYTFEQGLERYGLTPGSIDAVIHTHLHNDHCENDYKCENAVFYCHPEELNRIHDPHPLDYRYLEDYIEDAEQSGRIQTVSEDGEIFPGVSVSHTPVHTPGGLTVWVETAQGVAAITGFCVIEENFFPPPAITGLEMAVIPPGTVVNAYAAYDIMEDVKARADILIPLHEPRFAAVETIPA